MDVQQAAPFRIPHVAKGYAALDGHHTDARIVDQDIDLAEGAQCAGNDLFTAVYHRDRVANGSTAVAVYRFDNAFGRMTVDVVDQYRCASFAECFRMGFADAMAGAGDYHHAIIVPKHVSLGLCAFSPLPRQIVLIQFG